MDPTLALASLPSPPAAFKPNESGLSVADRTVEVPDGVALWEVVTVVVTGGSPVLTGRLSSLSGAGVL